MPRYIQRRPKSEPEQQPSTPRSVVTERDLEQRDTDEGQAARTPTAASTAQPALRRRAPAPSGRSAARDVASVRWTTVVGDAPFGGRAAHGCVDPRSWRRSGAELEVDDDALCRRPRRVAREQRGRRRLGRVDDPDGVGLDDLDPVDRVGDAPASVVNTSSSPATSWSTLRNDPVARAVASDDDVAELAGHRRAGPVAGTVVERGQADAFVAWSCRRRVSGSRSSRARYGFLVSRAGRGRRRDRFGGGGVLDDERRRGAASP